MNIHDFMEDAETLRSESLSQSEMNKCRTYDKVVDIFDSVATSNDHLVIVLLLSTRYKFLVVHDALL